MRNDRGKDAGGKTAGVRLDRWLWAARLYKTRSLAVKAVDGGKVHLNGTRARRAKHVKPGDRLEVTKGIYEYHLIIRGISEKRGPASVAQELYDETTESREARELLKTQLKTSPTPVFMGKGRPTKKARREIDRLRRRTDESL